MTSDEDAAVSAGSASTGPSVVAIGGGHGLAATLAAVRRYAGEITAVVAVADDGGSTGRLRDALDLPALGDLRKALVALADPDSRLSAAMTHRFGAGDIVGHAFGNLLIAAMAEAGSGLIPALDEIGALTGGVGRVLPATDEPVVLHAVTENGTEVIGQVRIMRTPGVERVSLVPARPPAPREAIEAIAAADQIVLGPGSLYTSVLAATAVPGVRDAVDSASGRVVYICNLRPQEGETEGYDLAGHIHALARHGVHPDVVLYDPDLIGDGAPDATAVAARLAAANGLAHDAGLLGKALVELL